MLQKTKVTLGVAGAVLAIGAIGTGVAFASSPDGGTATPASPASSVSNTKPNAKPKHHSGLLARVQHGEVTLGGRKGGPERVVDVQRGLVQAVSATSITVRSADGFTATYQVNGSTKVRKDKQEAGIDKVAAGDRVLVLADKTGSGTGTTTATRINDRGPAPAGR